MSIRDITNTKRSIDIDGHVKIFIEDGSVEIIDILPPTTRRCNISEFLNVLEHSEDYLKAMHTTRDILAKEGFLYVEIEETPVVPTSAEILSLTEEESERLE